MAHKNRVSPVIQKNKLSSFEEAFSLFTDPKIALPTYGKSNNFSPFMFKVQRIEYFTGKHNISKGTRRERANINKTNL